MFFYQYHGSTNLEFTMLRRAEIFFAAVSELNDASECRPELILKGREELWQRLGHFVIFRVFAGPMFNLDQPLKEYHKALHLGERIGSRIRKNAKSKDIAIGDLTKLFKEAFETETGSESGTPYMRLLCRHALEVVSNLPKLIEEERYIASFAKNATNPTIWGHYADAEKGFTVVYETDDNSIHVNSVLSLLAGSRPSKTHPSITEIGIYKDARLELKEVEYARCPPKANAFYGLIPKFIYSEEEDHYDVPLQLPAYAEQKKEYLVGLRKYSGWKYEREIRAFFPTYYPLLPDTRALSVSRHQIKGIILGPKMSETNKARAVVCCHQMMDTDLSSTVSREASKHEFVFFQAQQRPNRFELAIVPLGVLSDHYYGQRLPITLFDKCDTETKERLTLLARSIEKS